MCAICPKCKNIIKELMQKRSGLETSRFFVDKGKDYVIYDEEEFESDGDYTTYECPECNEELFSYEDDAEKFLLNTDELAEVVIQKANERKDE